MAATEEPQKRHKNMADFMATFGLDDAGFARSMQRVHRDGVGGAQRMERAWANPANVVKGLVKSFIGFQAGATIIRGAAGAMREFGRSTEEGRHLMDGLASAGERFRTLWGASLASSLGGVESLADGAVTAWSRVTNFVSDVFKSIGTLSNQFGASAGIDEAILKSIEQDRIKKAVEEMGRLKSVQDEMLADASGDKAEAARARERRRHQDALKEIQKIRTEAKLTADQAKQLIDKEDEIHLRKLFGIKADSAAKPNVQDIGSGLGGEAAGQVFGPVGKPIHEEVKRQKDEQKKTNGHLGKAVALLQKIVDNGNVAVFA